MKSSDFNRRFSNIFNLFYNCFLCNYFSFGIFSVILINVINSHKPKQLFAVDNLRFTCIHFVDIVHIIHCTPSIPMSSKVINHEHYAHVLTYKWYYLLFFGKSIATFAKTSFMSLFKRQDDGIQCCWQRFRRWNDDGKSLRVFAYQRAA